MDLISANTVIVSALVAAGGALVAYQAGVCTKKSTKRQIKKDSYNHTSMNEDDWLPAKKKNNRKKNKTKNNSTKEEIIYKPISEAESEDEEEKEEVKKVEVPKYVKANKSVKPTPTPVPAPAPAPVKKELTEVELKELEIENLRRLLAAAEGKTSKAKTTKTTKSAPTKVVQDVYNPVPEMSKEQIEEQRAEEQRISEEYHSEWTHIPKKIRVKKEIPEAEVFVPRMFHDLSVPLDKRGLIIGPKGETLNRITEISGAKIDIPKQGSANAKFSIEGTDEEFAAAKTIIMDLINKGFSPTLSPELKETFTDVPVAKRQVVIGSQGANIKIIQQETNTTVNFPDRASNHTTVQIVGDAHGIAVAKGALRQLVENGYSTLTHPNWNKIEVSFPNEYRRNLIGHKGSVIKAIQGNTGCKISFPDNDDNIVIIAGPNTKIYEAASSITRVQQKLDTPVEDTFAEGFDEEDVDFSDEEW